jgi:hypothetical protein
VLLSRDDHPLDFEVPTVNIPRILALGNPMRSNICRQILLGAAWEVHGKYEGWGGVGFWQGAYYAVGAQDYPEHGVRRRRAGPRPY